MPRQRFKPEQIIGKLRAVEIVVAKGSTMAEACRQIGIVHSGGSFAASSPDAQTCPHNLDGDRGQAAAMSDPAKKTEAIGHLKAAYTDEKEGKFTDCLSELKAAEVLMQ